MFDMLFRQDGERVDYWTDFRWDAPSSLLLDVGVTTPGRPQEEGDGYFGVHFLTPETETSTHYHFSAIRRNARAASSQDEKTREKIAEMRRFAFRMQDEPMITAQQRNLQMSPSFALGSVALETDVGVFRWRRIMSQLLADEQAAQSAEQSADQKV